MSIRRLMLALVTAGSAMVAVAVASAPAHATDFSAINVWNSSHCLDNATENNAKLQMWSCNGGSQQNWLEELNSQASAFTFTNQRTGWCISAPASGAGTVTMATCNPLAPTQQWRVYFADNPLGPPSGWYDVWQNVSSGLCLTTPSVGNGTLLATTTCDPSDQYDRWHQQ
jgi:hypothetical protein